MSPLATDLQLMSPLIKVQVLQYRLFVSLLILTGSPLGPGGPWKSKTNKSADLEGTVAKLFCVQAFHAS